MNNKHAVGAQMDRASGCGPEGRRFESRRLHQKTKQTYFPIWDFFTLKNNFSYSKLV